MINAIADLIIILGFFGGLFVLLGVIDGIMQRLFWRE